MCLSKFYEFFRQFCHSEERGIFVSNSTKIVDFVCGITCGDSSFLGMTNSGQKLEKQSLKLLPASVFVTFECKKDNHKIGRQQY